MDAKIQKALNEHLNREFYASYLYLSMSAYFKRLNLKGFAHWMHLQSQEEIKHAMKVLDYIIQRGGKVIPETIQKPEHEWTSPLAVFEHMLKFEKGITKKIHDLVTLAIETNDYATNIFLHWFVSEQVEEEARVEDVLQKLKMAKDPSAVLFMDMELGKREC